MHTTSSVVNKYWRLVIFILVIIAILWLLYALRSAIFPFIVGLTFAYLLVPLISWMEKKLPFQGKLNQTKRVSLIVFIFLIILGLIALVSFYLFTAVVNAFIILITNAPQYIARGLYELEQWAEALRQQFPPEMQNEITRWLVDGGTAAGNAIRDIFVRSLTFIPQRFSFFFGFAALPIFLFYVLKDSEKLKKGIYSSFSPGIAKHVQNVVAIIEGVLGRYIRAQLLLGLIVGYLCFIGLLILRVDFALVLAIFAGITELIPILGPWIGGATAVIVTLAVVPEKALWVALLFFLVQMLENNLLVPRIQGGYLRIHPAFAIVLLVMGTYVAGFWGLILAVPLTATIIAIYKYFHDSLIKEYEIEPPSNSPDNNSSPTNEV